MQIWHKKVTFTLPMAWLKREQERDRFLLCYTERINTGDAQSVFVSPEKNKGLPLPETLEKGNLLGWLHLTISKVGS